MLIVGHDEVNSKPAHAKPACAAPDSVRAVCLCATRLNLHAVQRSSLSKDLHICRLCLQMFYNPQTYAKLRVPNERWAPRPAPPRNLLKEPPT